MKTRRVRLTPEAVQDLLGTYDYLLPLIGDEAAARYVRRLREACEKLGHFPERGSRRDDLLPGLRLVGVRRKATIAFIVQDGEVRIIRVFGRGRDVDGAFSEE
ncbi:MAG: type II toxin-antitoxin system RelE/ParE family toxin [Beijerinckiaceae bacterium]